MKKHFKDAGIYLILLATLAFLIRDLSVDKLGSDKHAQFIEPELRVGMPWAVKSIDTQIVSKHWPHVPKEAIREQVAMLKALDTNFIAVGTPYDRVDELKAWADAIHNEGLNVWFRSHWAAWEGDDGKPRTLAPDDYLIQTEKFVRQNPDLFRPGDAFTAAVEPEQVGIGLGYRFLSWNQYRQFILDQVAVSNRAFHAIGLEGKIYTNWISVNGWVVENEFTPELVKKLGLITVDHFGPQSQNMGEYDSPAYIAETVGSDLDRMHKKFNVPFLLGEWGYQIHQDVSDSLQAETVQKTLDTLSNKNYIVGINYWSHMGHHSRIIDDKQGSDLKYRQAANVLKAMFSIGSASSTRQISRNGEIKFQTLDIK